MIHEAKSTSYRFSAAPLLSALAIVLVARYLILAVVLFVGCSTSAGPNEVDKQKVRALLAKDEHGDNGWWKELEWDGPVVAKQDGKPRRFVRFKLEARRGSLGEGSLAAFIYDVTDADATSTQLDYDQWGELAGGVVPD